MPQVAYDPYSRMSSEEKAKALAARAQMQQDHPFLAHLSDPDASGALSPLGMVASEVGPLMKAIKAMKLHTPEQLKKLKTFLSQSIVKKAPGTSAEAKFVLPDGTIVGSPVGITHMQTAGSAEKLNDLLKSRNIRYDADSKSGIGGVTGAFETWDVPTWQQADTLSQIHGDRAYGMIGPGKSPDNLIMPSSVYHQPTGQIGNRIFDRMPNGGEIKSGVQAVMDRLGRSAPGGAESPALTLGQMLALGILR